MNVTPIPSTESEFALLVKSLQVGNKEALDRIWNSFGPDLQRRARTRLRQYGMLGHTDSMDICNAVLLDLVRQERFEIKNPLDLMKYIRRAIDNQVRDEFKRLTRDRRDVRRNEAFPVENHRLENNKSSPSHIMIRNEIFERVVRQLGHDGEQLVALVLKEYSWEEIGRKLNMSADAARMRWNRAVKSVRTQMTSESEFGA